MAPSTLLTIFLPLLPLLTSVSAAITPGAPQLSETALPPPTTTPATISSYQSIFSSWRSSASHNPRLPVPNLPNPDPNGHTKCNWQCSSPCPCALEPVPPEDVTTASWSGKSVYSSSTVSLLPSVTDGVTASVEPLRTVIVRGTATATATGTAAGMVSRDENSNGSVVIDSEREKPIVQLTNIDDLDTNTNATTNNNTATPGPDETSTFYTLPLSGYHPAVLPLITTAHASTTPLTLLAYANTTLYSSFISSTLVAALNLTSTIIASSPSPFTPEHNLTTLLGFNTRNLGVVNLDVMAGRNDRLVRGWPFVVFQAPGTGNGGRDGLWTVDLWVGWSFLNEVQGVMLTGEYSGSREAGARDGMGVLVQRVFERGGGSVAGGDGVEMVDEL